MSLGNVLAVAYTTQREKLTFLEEDDKVGRLRRARPQSSGSRTAKGRVQLPSWLGHWVMPLRRGDRAPWPALWSAWADSRQRGVP